MNDTGTTLVIELAGVCFALAAGFVHMIEAWPSPLVPVVWMGAVFVLFAGYRAVLLVRQKYFPAPEPAVSDNERAEGSAGTKHPSLKWSAVEPNVPTESGAAARADGPLRIPGADGDFAGAELATMGLPAAALGEVSEDPTAFLDNHALRPETDDDLSKSEGGTIPLFAESTMSIDERTLAMQAVEVGDGDADSEGPTAPMQAVDRPAADEPAPDKTEALDEDGLRDRFGDDAADLAKTQKSPAVSAPRRPFDSPRKPFANTQTRGDAGQSPKPSTSREQPVAPVSSVDGVQMFDAEKLRQMQEKLEHQKEADDREDRGDE